MYVSWNEKKTKNEVCKFVCKIACYYVVCKQCSIRLCAIFYKKNVYM